MFWIGLRTHYNADESNKIFRKYEYFTFWDIRSFVTWHDMTFTHLADTFIQSDLQCIQAINYFLSVHVFPGNRTHNICAANAML